MTIDERIDAIVALMLGELPADGSNIGNGTLIDAMRDTATALGQGLTLSDDEFHVARALLLASGLAKKGKGRGGSTAHRLPGDASPSPDELMVTPAVAITADQSRPAFALQGEVVPAEAHAPREIRHR